MRRTSGELLVRRRSSSDDPLPPAGAGALTGARGAAAGAATARGAGAGAAGAGADGAGAAAATAAPFSVSMRATTVMTPTVFPSPTMISASTPAVGDGISASTLSVEISKIGSSRFTSSPTFFSQRETVPSAMDSPIWGIKTSIRATIPSSVQVYSAFFGRLMVQITISGSERPPSAAPTPQ